MNKKTIIISVIKGIEQTTHKTVEEILGEFLPSDRFAILGGAMLAEELQEGSGGVGVAGVKNKKVCNALKHLFRKTDLRIECLPDVRGVALAGVLKNIYAVGLGIADGLSWGNNRKSFLTTTAIKEIAEIIGTLGGKRETAYSMAGLGDLIATGYSSYSRNHGVGYDLVKTGVCRFESEGSRSLLCIAKLLKQKKVHVPFFETLKDVLIKNQDARIAFKNFIEKGRS